MYQIHNFNDTSCDEILYMFCVYLHIFLLSIAISTWSSWQRWSSCSVTCDEGTQRRRRTCQGTNCPGSSTLTRRCSRSSCPNQIRSESSTWTQWTEWGDCRRGQTERTRTCQKAQNGPRCAGGTRQFRSCDGNGRIGI